MAGRSDAGLSAIDAPPGPSSHYSTDIATGKADRTEPLMKPKRRKILQAAVTAAAALSLPLSRKTQAAEWNKAAFGAGTPAEALKQIGAANAVPSKDILVKLPDVAENGAAVPIEVTSKIPNTQSIAIVADKNPFPLLASFEFSNNAEAYASTRIKLAGTTDVRVIAAAGGRHFVAVREVKVVTGGCG
jgi:sulfur-oxidizing protein SoxY